MSQVKVGIIGLGQVAQIIHLPILRPMPDQYEIAALCDVSEGLLHAVGGDYGVVRRYTDAADLVAQDDIDAVFVLNSDEYHAEHTVLAARAGKHVLVEKPMCLTLREAEEIVAARDTGGVQVMVAYMRRFAPAFVEAVKQVRQLERIDYVRVRDIIGQNVLIIEQSSRVHWFDDIPSAAKADRADRARSLVIEAIGELRAELVTTYRMLLGLGSHDLSAMRELIGVPQRVVAAAQWNGGRFMTAIFEYDGFNATFEIGVDRQRRFDAHLEVYGDTRQIRVQYNTPFIRHLPTTLVIGETIGDAYNETIHRPTYKDPYTHELEVFHTVATGKATPKTLPEDSMEDLRLFREIIDV
ncbi:MAG: Gfo/Idh/MocA family oxidoreductase, partial [Chloroflexota bacterium]|nr:Gfo/Idh/MocA family oxidoreductase [Chloroflexota bacterium]